MLAVHGSPGARALTSRHRRDIISAFASEPPPSVLEWGSERMIFIQPGLATNVIERVCNAVWRLAVSPRTALVTLALLLVATVLGGLLPQASPALERGSSQYDAWLGQARSRYGSSVDVLESLGLLRVFSSRLFRLLLALASGVSLLRMLQLWVPPWVSPCRFPVARHTLSLRCDSEEAWQRVMRAVAMTGQRLARHSEAHGVKYAVARRKGPQAWVPGLFYLGLLPLLLASVVEHRWGWAGPPVELALGETQSLGRSTGLVVSLDQIAFHARDDGTMQRFDSLLGLLRGALVEKRVAVGLGKPAAYRGVRLYQFGFGPSVQVMAHAAEGDALQVKDMLGDPRPQHALRLRFSGQQQERLLSIPEADLVVRLLHYPSLQTRGIQGRALHVQIHRASDGLLLAEEYLDGSGQVGAGDATVSVVFEYYVTLRAKREPGLSLAVAGGLLMLVGMVGFVVCPPRDVWLSVRSRRRGSVCDLEVAERDVQAQWFLRLVSQVAEVSDG